MVDLNSGALPAVLPVIEGPLHLTVAELAAVVALFNIIGAIVQPVFGHLNDRSRFAYFVPIALILASFGLAGIGLAANYRQVLALTALSAVGVAIFHPVGSQQAFTHAGDRRASGMSIFSVGGNVGFGIGSLVIAACTAAAGLKGTLFFLLPGLFGAAVFFMLGKPETALAPAGRTGQGRDLAPDWVRSGVLVLVLIARSAMMFSLLTFTPLYLVHRFGVAAPLASSFDAAFLIFGALGTLAGGRFADAFGRKAHLSSAFVLTAASVALLPHVSLLLLIGLLALAGFSTVSTFPTGAVLAQELLPKNRGLAAGLALGFSTGAGGLIVFFLGGSAQSAGLGAVLSVLFVLPLLATVLSLALPGSLTRRPLTT